jgi:hypothetical protein
MFSFNSRLTFPHWERKILTNQMAKQLRAAILCASLVFLCAAAPFVPASHAADEVKNPAVSC